MKICAKTGSGKKIAGLLKKKIEEYNDTKIEKLRVCGFFACLTEGVYEPVA